MSMNCARLTRVGAARSLSIGALLLVAVGVGATDSATATYELQSHVVGAGGARMTGADGLTLSGTVGQSAAGGQTQAGQVSISDGFWHAGQSPSDRIFANGFE
jgi:hypothetical protein